MERGEIVWQPAGGAEETRLAAFARAAEVVTGRSFPDYRSLWQWSIDDIEGFWAAFAGWIDFPWTTPPARVLAGGDRTLPGARWFPGGEVNYAAVALSQREATPTDIAVLARSESRPRIQLTWAELADAVARCRAGLQRAGVTRGDRVAAYLPNIPETVIAFLATASVGAVWCSCAPEFGVRSVIDRLSQIEPVVLFAIESYIYGGRTISRHDEVAAIAAALPSLRTIVRVPYGASDTDDWSTLLGEPAALSTDRMDAADPLYVLFSSGTTGLPKPIVHAHGGIALEHLKALTLHHDLGAGDRFFWFTTTGWMMWNYLVSGLLTGATIVLFDGDPAHPDLMALWRLAAEEHIRVFGVSAPFLMSCHKAELQPAASLDLSTITQVGSTGAPLPAGGFRWVHDCVGESVQVASISGGTDVCTAFVGMSPTLAVRAGEISCALLGCDVRALQPDGSACRPGELGELVVAAPMPSMPVGFWGDAAGTRVRAAYFEAYAGFWHHGDWITFFDDGACVISGRSDATLNRGGVRLGTSDFYTVVERFAEVADSLVVHLDGGAWTDQLVLFVQLAPGAALDDDLRRRIVAALRAELSPRHAPDRIEAVRVIPRTLSGKKLEVPVKRILQGSDPNDVAARGALADPTALDDFTHFALHP